MAAFALAFLGIRSSSAGGVPLAPRVGPARSSLQAAARVIW
jgi:hypothetical protein